MGKNDSRRRSSLAEDAAALASMGHKQELQRNFSMLSMLGLAFAILNSWTALSASLSLALPSGGPTSVIWGLVTAGVCNLCLAASLAEFLSAYVYLPKGCPAELAANVRQIPHSWGSIPLGGSHQLEVLGTNTFMDHWLDQHCRM